MTVCSVGVRVGDFNSTFYGKANNAQFIFWNILFIYFWSHLIRFEKAFNTKNTQRFVFLENVNV